MDDHWSRFDRIVRRAHLVTEAPSEPPSAVHPFDERNVHDRIARLVKKLFDDGHYAQATFEAYKFIDKEVQRHAKAGESGEKLMHRAFSETSPLIQLTPLKTESEVDEQRGYRFLFAGSIVAIRNPRGHELTLPDTPDQCLDHLGLASALLRRLEQSGFR